MFTKLNDRLEQVKEKKRKKQKLEERYRRLTELQQAEQAKVDRLRRMVEKEERDVQKLEGLSITNLFYTFLGRKLEKIDQEKQEALAAKLKYDEAADTLQDIKNELAELEIDMHSVADAEEQYKELLKEKEALIKDKNTIWNSELYQLTEQITDLKTNLKEYREAIDAGNAALTSVRQAIEALEKAKGWATWDLFGGGMISTAIKHSHVNDARTYIHKVQTKLRHFEEELSDLRQSEQIQVEIGSFLTFADYFFDGFIVDWVVRGRISESLEQTLQTRKQVIVVLNRLNQQHDQLEEKLKQAQQARKTLLERME